MYWGSPSDGPQGAESSQPPHELEIRPSLNWASDAVLLRDLNRGFSKAQPSILTHRNCEITHVCCFKLLNMYNLCSNWGLTNCLLPKVITPIYTPTRSRSSDCFAYPQVLSSVRFLNYNRWKMCTGISLQFCIFLMTNDLHNLFICSFANYLFILLTLYFEYQSFKFQVKFVNFSSIICTFCELRNLC